METIELSAEEIGRIIDGDTVEIEYGCGSTRQLYDMAQMPAPIDACAGARNWQKLLTGEIGELSWARYGFRVVYSDEGRAADPTTIETAEQILNDDSVAGGYCLAVSRMVEALGYEIEEETTYEVVENESV